jgi:hypothetical protein
VSKYGPRPLPGLNKKIERYYNKKVYACKVVRYAGAICLTILNWASKSMLGENRQLVTDEPVKCEK